MASTRLAKTAALTFAILLVASITVQFAVASGGTGIVDDFEDQEISEYGGQTDDYNISSSTVENGSYSLNADLPSGTDRSIYSVDGNGLNQYPEPGDTFKVRFYSPQSTYSNGFLPNIYYGVQNTQFSSEGKPNETYFVGINGKHNSTTFGVAYMEGGTKKTTNFETKSVTWATGWWTIKVRWQPDGSQTYTLIDPNGDTEVTLTGTDERYKDGGVGFRYLRGGGGPSNIYFDNYEIVSASDAIQGTVTDGGGSAVSDAKIEAKNTTSGNVEETASADSNGDYHLSLNASTTYDLTVYNTSYSNKTKTVDVKASGNTVDFCLGDCSSDTYTQEFELVDHTGHFTDSTLYIAKPLSDYGISPPAGSDDWTRVQTHEFDYRNRTSAQLEDGQRYRLTVHDPDPDGDARHVIAGWEADNTSTLETIQIGENTTENATATPNGTVTPTGTVTPDGSIKDDITVGTYPGGLRIKYNGEPIEDIQYDVQGPNGSTYRVNRSFDDPTSYFTADLNDTLTNNASEHPSDYAVNYSGEYADGEVFNGSSDVEAGLFSSATGDSSGGGGAFVSASQSGSGLSAPEAGLGLVALGVAGFAAYRRFAGGGGGGAPPA